MINSVEVTKNYPKTPELDEDRKTSKILELRQIFLLLTMAKTLIRSLWMDQWALIWLPHSWSHKERLEKKWSPTGRSKSSGVSRGIQGYRQIICNAKKIAKGVVREWDRESTTNKTHQRLLGIGQEIQLEGYESDVGCREVDNVADFALGGYAVRIRLTKSTFASFRVVIRTCESIIVVYRPFFMDY